MTTCRELRRRVLVTVVGMSICMSAGCGIGCEFEPSEVRADASLDQQLASTTSAPVREGLAATILIDVSGSMSEDVAGEGGAREPKIDIARGAAHGIVEQFERYAADHPGEPVRLGIYEFSRRDGQPDLRPLLPMDAPSRAGAAAALARAIAEGGTPIGSALIGAKHQLDATGLTRRHLLVVTDGENTHGVATDRVVAAIGRRPEAERPSIYFVAFDIDARVFGGVRDAGGLLMTAGNAKELNDTLDGLLRGRILVEQ